MARANFRRNVRISKLQSKNKMVGSSFNPGGNRSNTGWLGSWWYDVSNFKNNADMVRQRDAYLRQLRSGKLI